MYTFTNEFCPSLADRASLSWHRQSDSLVSTFILVLVLVIPTLFISQTHIQVKTQKTFRVNSTFSVDVFSALNVTADNEDSYCNYVLCLSYGSNY